MAKFRISWWEERIYSCEVTIEAKTKEEAIEIAMESGNENEKGLIRDWVEKEENSYYEDLIDTTDQGYKDSEVI